MINPLSTCDRVLLEIIETERNYVRDLQDIIKAYLEPLRALALARISSPTQSSTTDITQIEAMTPTVRDDFEGADLKEIRRQKSATIHTSNPAATLGNCPPPARPPTLEQIERLFGNLEQLVNFNKNLLSQLESAGLDAVEVAHCFVTHSPGFAPYGQYCTNYPRSVALLMELMLNKETANWFLSRQLAAGHSLPLSSYLLKPVQRILKYHLLLESLLKQIDSESEDYDAIKLARTVMIDVSSQINETTRMNEQNESRNNATNNKARIQRQQSILRFFGRAMKNYSRLPLKTIIKMGFLKLQLRNLYRKKQQQVQH